MVKTFICVECKEEEKSVNMHYKCDNEECEFYIQPVKPVISIIDSFTLDIKSHINMLIKQNKELTEENNDLKQRLLNIRTGYDQWKMHFL